MTLTLDYTILKTELVIDIVMLISTETAINANFQISHCKSMAAFCCHNNQTAGAIAKKKNIHVEASPKIVSV